MKQILGSEELGKAVRRAEKKLRSLGTPARSFLQGVLCLLLGFLLGRLELPGGISPLGCGFTAACGATPLGTAAAVGVMLGAVSGLGLTDGLRPAASVLLIYSALFLLRDWRLSRRRFFPPLVSAIMTAGGRQGRSYELCMDLLFGEEQQLINYCQQIRDRFGLPPVLLSREQRALKLLRGES